MSGQPLASGRGNMADAGSVAWQFQQRGVVVVEAAPEEQEELTLAAIDAGADDFETGESALHTYSTPNGLEEVRKSLEDRGASIKSSDMAMLPNNTIPLDEKTAIRTMRLLDQLEELDDIQRVFSNADFPDSALEQYESEG